MKAITPIEYMINLEWDIDTLERAIKYLKDWDLQPNKFYKDHKKLNKNFDIVEREHYRNCVNFWKERLNSED